MTPTTIPDLETLHRALPATPHPLVPWFSDQEILDLLQAPGGEAELVDAYNERERIIRLASDDEDGDPYRYGFWLDHWQDVVDLFRDADLVWVAGGKRASKSEMAAWLTVKAAMRYPKGVLWCFQDSTKTSIATQQLLIWKYLPREVKALNQKKDRANIHKVRWTLANGFTDGTLVLPNRTSIHFLTYNQEVKDFQGWEIGARVHPGEEDPEIPNIGAWADENLSLPWLDTIKFRLTTRSAKLLWTFSVLDGITPTIKEFLGTPRTLRSRAAELLPGRVNVPGLPEGHMPYIQAPSTPNSRAIYFHTDLNPFPPNYENVRKNCEGRSSDYIERHAYGYARDTTARAFPYFDEYNLIAPQDLPADLTIYRFIDPAGTRNWAIIWWAIDPKGRYYIIREWPDVPNHGEWAIPDDSSSPNPDGKAGPAQTLLGYGFEQYKQLLRRSEQIPLTAWDKIPMPHQRAIVAKELDLQPGQIPTPEQLAELGILHEPIQETYIDPRAGRNQTTAQKGGTCIIDELANIQRAPDGTITGEPILAIPASGVHIDEGLQEINRLLWWNKEQPHCPLHNEPRLYVSTQCQNVIWMLNHYTARGGERGACKDFADLLRYAALAQLTHITGHRIRTTGGGSY